MLNVLYCPDHFYRLVIDIIKSMSLSQNPVNAAIWPNGSILGLINVAMDESRANQLINAIAIVRMETS
jgi:hypothetical protein